jgi:hypothetical protein
LFDNLLALEAASDATSQRRLVVRKIRGTSGSNVSFTLIA